MKIRLVGLPDELAAAAARISTVLDVVKTSQPYPCRGVSRQYRVYLEVRLAPPATVTVERDDTRPKVRPALGGSA